jgi:hypothetical protein
MNKNKKHHAELLAMLDDTVADAADFFSTADENLCDGHQTAREVASHLAFWHCTYVGIAWALVTHREPPLYDGTFAELNVMARHMLKDETMQSLAERLAHRQKQLDKALRRLPDWNMNFPVKNDCVYESVETRVLGIEAHIRNHTARLRKAMHHGGAQREATHKVAA